MNTALRKIHEPNRTRYWNGRTTDTAQARTALPRLPRAPQHTPKDTPQRTKHPYLQLMIPILLAVALTATILPLFSQQAHAIQIVAGTVWNASDGARAIGRTVVIWRSDTNRSDNRTGIVNSQYVYAINCGTPGGFSNPCVHGTNVSIQLVFNGSHSSLVEWVLIDTTDASPSTDTKNFTMHAANPPFISINYPLNETFDIIGNSSINITVTNNSVFETFNATYTFINSTGNYTITGEIGFGNLSVDTGGIPHLGARNWSIAYNASALRVGNYTLCVSANNTFGQTNTTCIEIGITNVSPKNFIAYDDEIRFLPTDPIENENVTINLTVRNRGTGVANVSIEFWDSYHLNRNYTNGTLLGTVYYDLPAQENVTVLFNWTVHGFGLHSIYAAIDPPIATGGEHQESSEEDNLAYINISLPIWHYFVGNISGGLILGDIQNYTLIRWNQTNASGSNLYFTSAASSISWANLRALGRNTSSDYEYRHFLYIDSAACLNTSGTSDSINLTYTHNELPVSTTSIYAYGVQITNVPVTNSTNNSQFLTGILWDTSDDTDGGYDPIEQEDIVFVTISNDDARGKYGDYDFEIRIPAPLRSYTTPGTDNPIVVYVELK